MVVRDHHQRSWWGTTIKASRGWFGWVEAGGVGCPALRGPLYCSTLFFLKKKICVFLFKNNSEKTFFFDEFVC